MMDSHAHVISSDFDRYPVLSSYREFLKTHDRPAFDVPDLIEGMERMGVETALLVQRGQAYGVDNSYVCDLASAQPKRFRAVCAINASAPDCVATAGAWIMRGAAGFRLMQPSPSQEVDWIGGENAAGLWKLLSEVRLPLCVHLWPENRDRGILTLIEMMQRFPDIVVVVDHVSNIPLDGSGRPSVDAKFKELADIANVYVKLTTIPLGRLAKGGISSQPLVDMCLEHFGSSRLMWGSDIGQSPGSYADMVNWGMAAVSRLPPKDHASILGATAARVYQWDVPRRATSSMAMNA